MSQQTPEASNSTAHAAAGNLAFLLSVIRCGESLSDLEEANVRSVINRLEIEGDFARHLMARHAEVSNAARRLTEQLERVHDDPKYRRVWETAQSHHGQYEGLNYIAELNALRSLLKQPSTQT